MDEAGLGLIELGVLVGDPHRGLIDIGADRDLGAGLGRRDGQHARAAADVQHPIERLALEQFVIGQQTADGRAMVTGAERRARIDLQGDGA